MTAYSLYRFFDIDGTLLYVGMTSDLPSRMRQHAKDKEWWPRVGKITSETHPTEKAAAAAEATAIVAERPLHNIAGSGVDIELLKAVLGLRERWTLRLAARSVRRGANIVDRNMSRVLLGISYLCWLLWFGPLTYTFSQWIGADLPLLITTAFSTCALLAVTEKVPRPLLLLACSAPGSLGGLHALGALTGGPGWLHPALRVGTVAFMGLVLLWTTSWRPKPPAAEADGAAS